MVFGNLLSWNKVFLSFHYTSLGLCVFLSQTDMGLEKQDQNSYLCPLSVCRLLGNKSHLLDNSCKVLACVCLCMTLLS
jgi:hypothetical protein